MSLKLDQTCGGLLSLKLDRRVEVCPGVEKMGWWETSERSSSELQHAPKTLRAYIHNQFSQLFFRDAVAREKNVRNPLLYLAFFLEFPGRRRYRENHACLATAGAAEVVLTAFPSGSLIRRSRRDARTRGQYHFRGFRLLGGGGVPDTACAE